MCACPSAFAGTTTIKAVISLMIDQRAHARDGRVRSDDDPTSDVGRQWGPRWDHRYLPENNDVETASCHHLLRDQLVVRGDVTAGDGVACTLDPKLGDRPRNAG